MMLGITSSSMIYSSLLRKLTISKLNLKLVELIRIPLILTSNHQNIIPLIHKMKRKYSLDIDLKVKREKTIQTIYPKKTSLTGNQMNKNRFLVN